ncbi:MAG TPA: ABC transporter ATP-binding protein [Stellaceae bacterium]|nr:ABC transporter ATP-binding protein [Stellaceae bacterium]
MKTFVSPPPAFAVEVKGLTKIYAGGGRMGPKRALDGIDLDIPRGSIFGLLGPNGAGKSTLINILAGLVMKSGGTAKVWGIDIDREPRQARAAIGVVPQELNIDAFFTPFELMELQAGLYGVPAAERRTMAILDSVGLADKANAYARTLSGGMRRRLMVAKAMVHSPPVLVLDEPTAGVDVELRQQLWAQVRTLNASGVTILLTTHYLEEAEHLCDRVAIIDHGTVVTCESTASLLAQVDDKTLTIWLKDPLPSLPPSLMGRGLEQEGQDRLIYRYHPANTSVGTVLGAIAEAGLAIRDISSEETDLEDVFLRLTRSRGGRA